MAPTPAGLVWQGELPVIVPDWPAPPGVHAVATTRRGGVSAGPYASLDLGDHVGLSLIHISEPTRPLYISYAVFCLKKR